MSFLTALSLSFNNLRTKKARTLLTSFAGSIGIIGIASILALSTGVNTYIHSVEEETLSEYPLQIQNTGFNFASSMMMSAGGSGEAQEESGDVNVIQMVTDMFSTMDSNDLEALKEYLDHGDSGIDQYVSAIEYSYDSVPQIYREDGLLPEECNSCIDTLSYAESLTLLRADLELPERRKQLETDGLIDTLLKVYVSLYVGYLKNDCHK